MTKAQLEERLKALLSVPAGTMFYRDGMFTIYSPIGHTQCSGTGKTIQEAIFHCEYARGKVAVMIPVDRSK